MKNVKKLLLAGMLVLVAAPLLAQTPTGSVMGTIKDEQGGVLPGVTVSLLGKTGTKTVTSDTQGNYRFIGLDPGVYSVRAEIAGFQAVVRENNVIRIGTQLTLDIGLKLAGVSEAVEVVGEAPVVDTTSSSTGNALSQDVLFNIPIRPANAAVDLLNYTPGVNEGSAFGGDSDTANALLIDGVDTRDPEGGSAWAFFNFNIIEEVQVSGIGAPAEYGAFAGAVVNTVTKSGGNQFAGLFDGIFTNKSFTANNVSDAVKAKNSTLGSTAKTKMMFDYTAQLSGPIIKNKLFFFASVQRYYIKDDPAGARTFHKEVSPRLNLKLNWNPSTSDSIMGAFQYDNYNNLGRAAYDVLTDPDEITQNQDSPEAIWVGQWRHVFGSSAFSEVKYTGWWGYYDLIPKNNVPGHYDFSGKRSVSSTWFGQWDRSRHQVNASYSQFAEAFGKHDLKFGIEIERSKVRDRYGYVGGIYYLDNYGAPYHAYSYSYDLEGSNQRESVFAQDAWKVNDKLTINAGVRFDWDRGYATQTDEKLYDTKNIAPRLGFAFDPRGDHKTVIRGTYSQYYEGAFFYTFSGAIPGTGDFVTYDVTACPSTFNSECPADLRVEIDRIKGGVRYNVDKDIKHPRTDEISLGFERALTKDIRLAVTGIWRENKNFQRSVLPTARWTETTVTNGLTGQPLQVYEWANKDETKNDRGLLTNVSGFQYLAPDGTVLGTIDAYRRYKGLMFVIDKRMSSRWLGRLSYVLSKTEGSVDNNGFNSFGSATNAGTWETPSQGLVNTKGLPSYDMRHELKVMASYQIPYVEVGLDVYYRYYSGGHWTPYETFLELNYNRRGSQDIRLEKRGSRDYDAINRVDLRLEKIFNIRDNRLAVYVLINNLFNASTVNGIQNRYPNSSIATPEGDVAVAFGDPTGLVPAMQVTLGARWSF